MNIRFFPYLLIETSQHSKVGGQALIEGVMMRSKHAFSMAVRRKNGEIVCKKEPYTGLSQRNKLYGLPVVRGFIQLAESLYLGMKALNFSADQAMLDENPKAESSREKNWKDKITGTATIVLSFVVAMLLFMYLPLLVSSLIKKDQNPFLFNLTAGIVRMAFFLAYLWIISLWKDIRRVFEYHGAEHKSIFIFEAGEELTLENAKKFKTHHPRCGTSFLLIVACICILIFAVLDGIVAWAAGPYPNVFVRFLVHLVFIPLVSGVSYEVLKLSDKGKNNPMVSALIRPGLWLQKITTQEPSDAQLEVAFVALKAVL